MTAVNIAGRHRRARWSWASSGCRASGSQASVLVTTASELAAGVVAWLIVARRRAGARDLALAAAAVVAVARDAACCSRPACPADFLAATARWSTFARACVQRRRGAPRESLQLEIDRWWQGQNRKTHQIMAAHVPMLLASRAAPRAGGRRRHRPDREPLPDLPDRAARRGRHRARRVRADPRTTSTTAGCDDPRVRLVRDDGRNHLAHTDDATT